MGEMRRDEMRVGSRILDIWVRVHGEEEGWYGGEVVLWVRLGWGWVVAFSW
jgi:hypothetical protein